MTAFEPPCTCAIRSYDDFELDPECPEHGELASLRADLASVQAELGHMTQRARDHALRANIAEDRLKTEANTNDTLYRQRDDLQEDRDAWSRAFKKEKAEADLMRPVMTECLRHRPTWSGDSSLSRAVDVYRVEMAELQRRRHGA